MSLRGDITTTLLVGYLSIGVAFADASHDESRIFFSLNPPESNIQLLEDQGRNEWQKPEQVIEILAIKPGETIADIGSGTGYFTLPMAKKTGKDGTVYAVDIDRGMVDYLKRRVAREGLNNIKSLLATPEDPLLPISSADLIFICNTYLFIEKRDQYLTRLKAVLKKNGRLAVVSFNQVETPEGPPLHKRVSKERTIKEFEKAGFRLEAQYSFLPYQHFLIFKKI